jgi:hypothetical protein
MSSMVFPLSYFSSQKKHRFPFPIVTLAPALNICLTFSSHGLDWKQHGFLVPACRFQTQRTWKAVLMMF